MATETASAVINLDLPGAKISKHQYGHFAEHLGRCIYGGFWVGEDSEIPNERGIRLDVVEALKKLNIPNLRWPGGCFADEYHWQDGIGPRENRPKMVNSHWGNVVENNHFGTHEFMDLCELLGADAYIAGNVGSGTVQEMSQWVEYMTRDDDSPMVELRRKNGRDKAWKVPFWGVGNENWGCGGNMRVEQFADLARQYSTFCRDHGDNKLYRIAGGPNVDDFHWTETLMKSVGCVACNSMNVMSPYQAISLHYYTMTREWENKGKALTFTEDEYYRTMANSQHVDTLLTRHSTIMDHYDPCKTIGLVLDEWGTWWQVEEGTNPGFLYQQNTMRDALVASTHFDIFTRHAERLVMANIAQTVNVLQAMILTDPDTGALVLTPTYHVFEMNTAHHDALALDVSFRGQRERMEAADKRFNVVSASASVAEDGASSLLSLSNVHLDEARTIRIDLRGRDWTVGEARLLTSTEIADHNSPAHPEAVAPVAFDGFTVDGDALEVTLPAHSYVTIALDLA
ncbi:alpha-N-arabinofuranosidase [Timonella senegalensis]|uniref:alpha-N-arabinofuranosidase n=1 Tax=Timonella senegalensis TaxID=1465825 RepID=UPI0028AF6AF1|nr:alpha-L-arabinofuranosidase C-terminal domain-containing protein [Timonella senegalensis]